MTLSAYARTGLRLVAAPLVIAVAAALVAAAAPSRADVPYEVRLTGLEQNKALTAGVRDVSLLIGQRDKIPETLFMLEDRAREDAGRVRRYLRSEGYFAARVRQSVRPPADGNRALATLSVTPGPRYALTPIRVVLTDAAGGATPDGAALGLPAGTPGRSQPIIDARSTLTAWYAARAFPFAKLVERKVVVDHAKRSVSVTFRVARGPRVRVGAVVISGADGVKRWIIKRRIRFRRGDLLTTEAIAQTRTSLLELGVFSSVSIRPDRASVAADGTTRIVVSLDERKRRTLSARVFYDTSLGIGGELEWLHRNLFGAAERLRLRVGGTLVEYGARAIFEKPDIFDSPYSFSTEARYNEIDAPAYDGREAVLALALSRQFSKRLWIRAGPVVDWTEFNQEIGTRQYRLFGADLQLVYDASDDRFDPTSGYRVRLGLQPYAGSRLTFARASAMASAYWTPGSQRTLTIAGWTRIASVFGEEAADLPPNKRLYAGGGNSVRGFSFQRIGPLNSADNPIGGRSLLEGGLEARIRITKEWGAVIFVEAGTVNRSTFPDFDEPLQVGVGIGVRYNSPIGLIRLDVATPIRRREGDGIVQIYISIGQAF